MVFWGTQTGARSPGRPSAGEACVWGAWGCRGRGLHHSGFLCPEEPGSGRQESVEGRSRELSGGGPPEAPVQVQLQEPGYGLGVREVSQKCFPCRRALPGSGLGFTPRGPCPSCDPLDLSQVSGSLEEVGSRHLGSGLGTLVAGAAGARGGVCGLGGDFGGPE